MLPDVFISSDPFEYQLQCPLGTLCKCCVNGRQADLQRWYESHYGAYLHCHVIMLCASNSNTCVYELHN